MPFTLTLQRLMMPTIALLLAACGGGNSSDNPYSRPVEAQWSRPADINGSSNTPAPTPDKVNTAEGFWTGPASTGFTVSLAVLDNGEAWGVYSSGNTIYGALQGSLAGDGTTLSGSGTDYNFPNDSATPATVTGTVNQKTTMEAKTSTSLTMNLQYSAAYDQPATLDQLQGNYLISGRTFGGSIAVSQLAIDASGAFVLVDSGCTTTGNLVPRPGGKNIYNLNASFAGTPCQITGAVSGVAYLNTATNQLTALALNSSKTDGLIVVGTKR